MSTNIPEHWVALMELLEKSKADPEVREVLQTGAPLEVIQMLNDEGISITVDDLGKFLEDDWYLGKERNDKFWRW